MIRALTSLHHSVFGSLEKFSTPVMTTLARFVFAATLLMYYWNSGLQKLGEGVFGIFSPDFGAYAAILPKAIEAAGYDPANLTTVHWAIVTAGTWAEFILPALIIVGLFTRLAALGMIGFVAVQSWVDLFGHGGLANGVLGAWFDNASDGLILDQRAFWVFLLLYLVFRGGGPLSLDRFLSGASARQDDVLPAQG